MLGIFDDFRSNTNWDISSMVFDSTFDCSNNSFQHLNSRPKEQYRLENRFLYPYIFQRYFSFIWMVAIQPKFQKQTYEVSSDTRIYIPGQCHFRLDFLYNNQFLGNWQRCCNSRVLHPRNIMASEYSYCFYLYQKIKNRFAQEIYDYQLLPLLFCSYSKN